MLCNFQPFKHEDYHIGVPEYGIYDEVFNTDDPRYGGSGVLNGKGIETSDIAIHGCEQSISITVPPLSVSYFKLAEKKERPKKEEKSKKKVPKKAPRKSALAKKLKS